MARKTTITIETCSRVVLRAGGVVRAWCSICGAESEFIVIDSQFPGSESPWAQALLNSAPLHRLDAGNGPTLICLQSLLALAQTNPTRRATEGALQSPERKRT